MFVDLLGQHFVHNALVAGAIVAVVSGAIGWFVVTRSASSRSKIRCCGM